MKRHKVTRLILSVVLIAALFTGCNNKTQEAAAVQLTPVEAVKAVKGDIQATYTVTGKIKPLKEVAVVPKIPGKVENVSKDIGDTVAEGDMLFVVETKDLVQQLNQIDAQLLQSDAGVESAQINLSRTEGSSLDQQLMQAEVSLKHAEISFNTAKTDYESNKKLFDANAISKQMLDVSKDKYDLAQMQYNNARDSYDLIKNKIASESIDMAMSQVKQAQAGKAAILKQKEMLLQKIDDSTVTSPINGIIAQKAVERGVMATQQAPAFTVVDLDSVIVEASVTETIINSLARGQEVSVTVKSLNGKQFKGVIDAMSPSVTAQSIGYPVKIVIENKSHEIKPGMFAEIEFVTEKKKGSTLIPMESVLSDKGKNYVFVLEGDIVIRREVKTGLKDGKNIEILNSVKEGEQVIIKGQQYVSDGDKVQPAGGAQ